MDTENVVHPAVNFVHIFEKAHVPGLLEQHEKKLQWEKRVKEEQQRRDALEDLRTDTDMVLIIKIMLVIYFSISLFLFWYWTDMAYISGCEPMYSTIDPKCQQIAGTWRSIFFLFVTIGWVVCFFVGVMLVGWFEICKPWLDVLRGIPIPLEIPHIDIPEPQDTITPAMIMEFQEIERIAWTLSLREQAIAFSQTYQLRMIFPVMSHKSDVSILFLSTNDSIFSDSIIRTFTYEPLDKVHIPK